jgi:DNA-binding MarR family transcriptional regulator
MSAEKLSEAQEKVLKALESVGKPAGNKDIAQATGLDGKEVTKAIKGLKSLGLVGSPVRCKYAPTSK